MKAETRIAAQALIDLVEECDGVAPDSSHERNRRHNFAEAAHRLATAAERLKIALEADT